MSKLVQIAQLLMTLQSNPIVQQIESAVIAGKSWQEVYALLLSILAQQPQGTTEHAAVQMAANIANS